MLMVSQAIEDLVYLKTQPSLQLTSAVPIFRSEKDTIALMVISIPAHFLLL